jgi:hypothetical protein
VALPPALDPGLRAVLDRQVLVLLELSDEVLRDVSLTECLHKLHPESWTVHEINGHWFGELEEEPSNVPVPTLGWTMWHPVWWLETLLAVSRGEDASSVSEVEWPGPVTTIARIRELWSEWTSFVGGLTDDDLRSSRLTRFPYTDGRPFAYVLGWASMEMTKNLSEMCILRRLLRDSALS